jgi:transcriptional regulator with XRE-family HTH domain
MTTEPNNDIYPEDQEWLQAQIRELTFAEVLKAHRLCQEWTQEEAAKRLGISKQLVSAYEKGNKIPEPAQAYRIGKALGMVPEMAVIYAVNDALRRENLPLQVALAG